MTDYIGIDENKLSDLERKHVWCVEENKRRRIHELYGWTEQPNAQYFEKKTNADGWHFHSYNEYGFRGSFEAAPKVTFVLGDSFTRGTLADDSQTMPALLSSWVPNRAFYNFGVGGYGTTQEYLVYKDYSEKFDHDSVLLFFYLGNDADNNVTGNVRPQFVIKGTSLELIKPRMKDILAEARKEALNREERNKEKSDVLFKVKIFLEDNFRLYQFYAPKVGVALQRFGLGEKEENDQDTHGKVEEVSLDTKISISLAILRQFAEEVAEQGKHFYVVLLPERGEVDPRRAAHRSGTDYYVRLREALMQLGKTDDRLKVWDSTDALRSALQAGQRIYGIRNSHLSEGGYYAVAAFIFARLQEEGLVNPDLRPLRPASLPNFTTSEESELVCPNRSGASILRRIQSHFPILGERVLENIDGPKIGLNAERVTRQRFLNGFQMPKLNGAFQHNVR